MKIIFIAGPLTAGWDGKDRDFIINNVKEAEKYQIALISAGIYCFCPHNHTFLHHEKSSKASEEFYYKMNLEFLKRIADAVLALPNREKSNGTKKEVEWAITNGLPVFYPKSPNDIKDVIDWAKEEK